MTITHSVRHTRRRAGVAILALVFVVFALGAAIFARAWNITARAMGPQGCACAASAMTAQDGLLAGLAALFVLGIIAGITCMIITLYRTRRLVRRIEKGARLTSRFVVFPGPHCEAFTFGFLRPKIAICAHCIENLPSAELEAVLRHETHHAERRDPLRLFILSIITRTFFFVPLIRTLASLYRTASEIEADEQIEDQQALGQVLLRVTSKLRAGVAASFASAVGVRIERVVQPGWRMRLRVSPAPLLTSIMLLAVAALTGFTPSSGAPLASQCMQAIQCAASFDHLPAVYYNGNL